MFCPSCNNYIEDDSNFCVFCGYKIPDNLCPNCGFVVSKNAQFCKRCGAHILSGLTDPDEIKDFLNNLEITKRQLVEYIYSKDLPVEIMLRFDSKIRNNEIISFNTLDDMILKYYKKELYNSPPDIYCVELLDEIIKTRNDIYDHFQTGEIITITIDEDKEIKNNKFIDINKDIGPIDRCRLLEEIKRIEEKSYAFINIDNIDENSDSFVFIRFNFDDDAFIEILNYVPYNNSLKLISVDGIYEDDFLELAYDHINDFKISEYYKVIISKDITDVDVESNIDGIKIKASVSYDYYDLEGDESDFYLTKDDIRTDVVEGEVTYKTSFDDKYGWNNEILDSVFY